MKKKCASCWLFTKNIRGCSTKVKAHNRSWPTSKREPPHQVSDSGTLRAVGLFINTDNSTYYHNVFSTSVTTIHISTAVWTSCYNVHPTGFPQSRARYTTYTTAPASVILSWTDVPVRSVKRYVRLNYVCLLRIQGSGCSFLQQLTGALLACMRHLARWNYLGNNTLVPSQQGRVAEIGRLHDIRRPKLGNGWVLYLPWATEHSDALLFPESKRCLYRYNSFNLCQDYLVFEKKSRQHFTFVYPTRSTVFMYIWRRPCQFSV